MVKENKTNPTTDELIKFKFMTIGQLEEKIQFLADRNLPYKSESNKRKRILKEISKIKEALDVRGVK